VTTRGSGAVTLATATVLARPRQRGLPIVRATLRESRGLIGAACSYIAAIWLGVGLVFPALTRLVYTSLVLLLLGGVLAYAAGASIARNVEDGSLDLALARPVSRVRLYMEKWAALLIGMVVVLVVSLLTAWLDSRLFAGASVNWRWFLLGHLELGSMLFFVIGVGMLLSASMSAKRAAGATATLVTVFGYLAQTFGTASWSETWQFLPPVAVGLVTAGTGLVVFLRRDIAV
jgi:ABC-type transport system involved in multi-copper enzyme maturation permease subunit